jgi:hypothetical protein
VASFPVCERPVSTAEPIVIKWSIAIRYRSPKIIERNANDPVFATEPQVISYSIPQPYFHE